MQALKRHGLKSRLHCRIPMELECLSCPTYGLHEATILMIGKGRLYLETDHETAPGEVLRIHLLQKVSEELTWSRQIDNSTCVVSSSISKTKGNRYRYGAEARFEHAVSPRGKTRAEAGSGPAPRRRVSP